MVRLFQGHQDLLEILENLACQVPLVKEENEVNEVTAVSVEFEVTRAIADQLDYLETMAQEVSPGLLALLVHLAKREIKDNLVL